MRGMEEVVFVVVIAERLHRWIEQQETGNVREINEPDSKNKNPSLH
jgi:hypothetical protein